MTYNPKTDNSPRTLKKKVLDKSPSLCYNIYITIKKEKK